MKINKSIIIKGCLKAGICLFVVGMIVFGVWQWQIHSSRQKANSYIEILHELIPISQGGFPEKRYNNAMPSLNIGESDFVGILEMPRYELELPICDDWGEVTKYPCRFDGSVYDGSLQIGATSQKGQFDFYREISVGDSVIFTDMEGNRYTYAVSDLKYADHADKETLNGKDSALTFFIKNIYDFNYLIVYCDVLN